MPGRPSSSLPLAVAYAVLVVYASLYPLSGWHHPLGLSASAFLSLPWPRWWGRFDVVANLLGYLPLGALVFAAALRGGRRRAFALLAGAGLPTLLSLLLELTQNYLPQRVPSALDLVLNAAGAALGALLAAAADALGMTRRWQTVRRRWFIDGSAGAMTLLLMWPVGLLYPTPVPLGVGQVWPWMGDVANALGEWIEGVPWAAGWAPVLVAPRLAATPLSAPAELALTAFGLLAPCLLAYTVTRPGWRRLVLALGATALGLGASMLSTTLSFGPEHALAWMTSVTVPALAAALILAALAAGVSRGAAGALALVATTALVVLSAQMPADPYFAHSLQAWEQGRFIRFHGLAQWVGRLWPYAVLLHLLLRIGARDAGGEGGLRRAP